MSGEVKTKPKRKQNNPKEQLNYEAKQKTDADRGQSRGTKKKKV